MKKQIDEIGEIEKLNQYQVISAEQRIIVKDEKILTRYVDNFDLMEKRKAIRNSEVNTVASSEPKVRQALLFRAADIRNVSKDVLGDKVTNWGFL